jgi:glutamine cyclotransferase
MGTMPVMGIVRTRKFNGNRPEVSRPLQVGPVVTFTPHVFRLAALGVVLALPVLLRPYPSFPVEGTAPTFGYRVVNVFPHDRKAFTQGLAWDEGNLLESTGLYGKSSLRRVELRTGRVLKVRSLRKKFFGEGAAPLDGHIVQLTWRSGTGFVYDRASFEPLSTFTVTGEGWGITWDGRRLILSDGSDTLRLLDPESFGETGRLRVRDGDTPVRGLNELEYVKGEILANVWRSNRIARISPETGQVTGWIDLEGILAPLSVGQEDVLNGIAYDPGGDRLFVTGKRWPRIFEIEIIPAQ